MATTTKRWFIGGLLFASLALNLFLGGFLLGDDKFPPPPPGGPFAAFNEKAERLPEPARDAVKKVLAEHQPKLKKQMRKVMKARDALDTMFKREDYSRAEAEARFEAIQKESLLMQELAQAMLLDVADAVPAPERAAFMERPKEWRGKGAAFRDHPHERKRKHGEKKKPLQQVFDDAAPPADSDAPPPRDEAVAPPRD